MTFREFPYDKLPGKIIAWTVFILASVIYWITADRYASFWDSPEYVVTASLLEIGHPPGNPFWTLFMRVITIPFPQYLHAFVINLCDGLLMAGAAALLADICYIIFSNLNKSKIGKFASVLASFSTSLSFAFCDSAWFSATETEVYAMSAFLSMLTLRIMIKWYGEKDRNKRFRLIVLIGYLTGLSLGVHQLNLLMIPVLALIGIFRYREKTTLLIALSAIIVSLAVIAMILMGMMPGLLRWAGMFELTFVNALGLPYFSGVIVFWALLVIITVSSSIGIIYLKRQWRFPILFIFLIAGGFTLFGSNLIAGCLIALVLALTLSFSKVKGRILSEVLWTGTGIIIGYSVFSIILIRGYAEPSMNEGSPTDIFSLSSYVGREQYGQTPLLRGRTPYSRPLLKESRNAASGVAEYTHYMIKKESPRFMPWLPGGRLYYRSSLATKEDSTVNDMVRLKGSGYVMSDYNFSQITTPELDIWFPRITSNLPADIDAYESWAGMNTETMTEINISETKDLEGNFTTRENQFGEREVKTGLRPTLWHNLRFFFSYQLYYMYIRYLLWNFAGRQNDYHSTGEIDHGNFITGFPPLDRIMIGDYTLMPDNIGIKAPGRNVYFCLPLLFGIAGIIILCFKNRQTRRLLYIIALFFFMTGPAIVIYLNQSPGEPRERDYAFIASYMAFTMWIGTFVWWAILKFAKYLKFKTLIIPFAIVFASLCPALLFGMNFDDHDRRGRGEPLRLSSHILAADSPSIIFTQGDNFTFPLWYSKEVERLGSQHTIIDISYLSTPGYVANLMKQSPGGLQLIADQEDILYNAYATISIQNNADSIPISIQDALRELYARKNEAPVWTHNKLYLTTPHDGDTIFFDIRDFTEGHSFIPFRQLILMDIIASEISKKNGRNLIFLNQISPNFYQSLKDYLNDGIISHRIISSSPTSQNDDILKEEIKNVLADSTIYMPRKIDPVVADLLARRRAYMIAGATHLLTKGETEMAINIVRYIERQWPHEMIPSMIVNVNGKIYHEGPEYIKLLKALYDKTGKEEYLQMARAKTTDMLERGLQWEKYYKSLPYKRRKAMSRKSLNEIALIPELKGLITELQ